MAAHGNALPLTLMTKINHKLFEMQPNGPALDGPTVADCWQVTAHCHCTIADSSHWEMCRA